MRTPSILLTGATGFLGKALCREFVKKGIRPRCLVRAASDVTLIDSLKLDKVIGDVTQRKSLEAALNGVDAVVHAAAVTNSPDPAQNYQVNVEGTQNLIWACKEYGTRRVISLSSICATQKKRGSYGNSKLMADNAFLASNLDVTIIRPTLIWGTDSRQVGTIKRFLKIIPAFVPVISNGQYLIQPVALEDVVKVVVSATLTHPPKRLYYAAGPQRISFNEMLSRILVKTGIKKRLIHLPFFFVNSALFLAEKFIKNLPVNTAQLTTVCQDGVCDTEETERDFGVTFKPFDQIIEEVFAKDPYNEPI